MNTPRSIIVLGAGGHAKAVVGAAQISGIVVEAVYDDDAKKWGRALLGVSVLGPMARVLDGPRVPAIVAIADAAARQALVTRYHELQWATLVHPRAFVHASVTVGVGTVIFAGVMVQPDATIGEHAIVNANATVAHGCHLEDYVHLAPGVDLASGVHVGKGAFVGTGAVASPAVRIGAWTTVGAGASVVSDLPDHVVAVGVPAAVIRHLAGVSPGRNFDGRESPARPAVGDHAAAPQRKFKL